MMQSNITLDDIIDLGTNILDKLGLTSVHQILTEILLTFGFARESAGLATGVIYALMLLAIVGYLANSSTTASSPAPTDKDTSPPPSHPK